ncbi:MAG TPA: hypothetical protein VMT20_22005 [Terriglobia bacterium]|nr:hypothetical protein [Terriglobia bacterium]
MVTVQSGADTPGRLSFRRQKLGGGAAPAAMVNQSSAVSARGP